MIQAIYMGLSLEDMASRLRRVSGRLYMHGVEKSKSVTKGTPGKLPVERLSSQKYFVDLVAKTQSDKRQRLAFEHALSQNQKAFRTPGYCFACSRWSHFYSSWDYAYEVDGRLEVNWREHLVCRCCNLNNRMRASIHLAALNGLPLEKLDVYATEEITQLFAWLKPRCRSLVGSEYLGDTVPRGTKNAAGVTNQDLTQLTFSNNQFDLILSFEVMEHVPNYFKAFKECARVLKPGGKMLFSTPFNACAPKNLIRARLRADNSVEHLLPPEYHGDPLSSAGCLCFTTFGWEMLDQVRQSGFNKVTALLYYSPEYGYLGDQQIQFLAEK